MLVVRLLSTSKYDQLSLCRMNAAWIHRADLDSISKQLLYVCCFFLVFDVETVFLFRAIRFSQLGPMAFIEMVLFVAMLLLALWYA